MLQVMGRELGAGDIEQQDLGVLARRQRERALGGDPRAIPGGQHEVAERDLALHDVQPRGALGRDLVDDVLPRLEQVADCEISHEFN
jgi:hypothetical protein